jgi:hypothetical protein
MIASTSGWNRPQRVTSCPYRKQVAARDTPKPPVPRIVIFAIAPPISTSVVFADISLTIPYSEQDYNRVECEEWRVELWCPAVRRTIGIGWFFSAGILNL